MVYKRDDATLNAVIEGIYAAVLDPGCWSQLLPELLKFANAPRGTLGVVSSAAPTLYVTLTHELDPDLNRVWQEEFSGYDPVIARCGVPLAGTVFRAWDVVPPDEYRGLDLYRGCFGRAGVDDHLITALTSSGDRGTYLSAFRSEEEGAFSDEDVRAYSAFAPHLARAARIQAKLLALSGRSGADLTTAEPLPFAAFLVDDRGVIVALNAEAQRLATQESVLRVRAGRVALGSLEADRAYQRALAHALGREGSAGSARASVLSAPRHAPEGPLQVLITPVGGGAPRSFLGLSTRHAAALIVISDPVSLGRPPVEVFARLFGLSPALSQLAAALVDGRTLHEHAAEARISARVARWRMRALFARTDTTHPTELVEALRSAVAQLRMHGP